MRSLPPGNFFGSKPALLLVRGGFTGLLGIVVATSAACDTMPEQGASISQQAHSSACAPRRMLNPSDYGDAVDQLVEAVAMGTGLPRALLAQRQVLSEASPEVFEMDGMTRNPMDDYDESHRFAMQVNAPAFGGEPAEVVVTLSTNNKGLRRDYGDRWIPDVHQVLDIVAQWAPRDRVQDDDRVTVVMSFYREVVPAEQNLQLAVTGGYFSLLLVDILVPVRIDREVPDEHHAALEQLRQSFNRAMLDPEFEAWRSAKMENGFKDELFDAPPWGTFMRLRHRAVPGSALSRYVSNSPANLRFDSSHEFFPNGGRFEYLRLVDGPSRPGQWIEGVLYLEDVSRHFQDVEVIDIEFIGREVIVTRAPRPTLD